MRGRKRDYTCGEFRKKNTALIFAGNSGGLAGPVRFSRCQNCRVLNARAHGRCIMALDAGWGRSAGSNDSGGDSDAPGVRCILLWLAGAVAQIHSSLKTGQMTACRTAGVASLARTLWCTKFRGLSEGAAWAKE